MHGALPMTRSNAPIKEYGELYGRKTDLGVGGRLYEKHFDITIRMIIHP